jgi:hypothetical protein
MALQTKSSKTRTPSLRPDAAMDHLIRSGRSSTSSPSNQNCME